MGEGGLTPIGFVAESRGALMGVGAKHFPTGEGWSLLVEGWYIHAAGWYLNMWGVGCGLVMGQG